MNEAKLTKRDFEILRTLVRVQLARTRSLHEAGGDAPAYLLLHLNYE